MKLWHSEIAALRIGCEDKVLVEITDRFEKASICDDILRSLPDWFGIETAILDYVEAVKELPMFAFKSGIMDVAFISLKLHTEFAAEIYVMGVKQEFHRMGKGSLLVDGAEDFLRKNGYRFFSVKTLSQGRECEAYEKTRKFYLSKGFVPIEEFPTLWGEANPCLFMIKSI